MSETGHPPSEPSAARTAWGAVWRAVARYLVAAVVFGAFMVPVWSPGPQWLPEVLPVAAAAWFDVRVTRIRFLGRVSGLVFIAVLSAEILLMSRAADRQWDQTLAAGAELAAWVAANGSDDAFPDSIPSTVVEEVATRHGVPLRTRWDPSLWQQTLIFGHPGIRLYYAADRRFDLYRGRQVAEWDWEKAGWEEWVR